MTESATDEQIAFLRKSPARATDEEVMGLLARIEAEKARADEAEKQRETIEALRDERISELEGRLAAKDAALGVAEKMLRAAEALARGEGEVTDV